MRLTYDQFAKLPMQYVFGLNAEDYCARRYRNEQFGITKEVVTPRMTPGNHYSGFGKPEVCFYMGDGPTHPTARALYEGEFLTPWLEGVAPCRPGWYETDRGMLFFETQNKEWYRSSADCFAVLPPKQWRGMADVKSNPTSTERNA